MPIHKIEVSEYECSYCGYKWVNRANGRDGPVPKRCAKCKRAYWNEGGRPEDLKPMTSQEVGLRTRVKGLRGLYIHKDWGYWDGDDKDVNNWIEVPWDDVAEKWPEDLTEKFLSLQPRPTIHELGQVVYPKGLPLAPLDSQNQYRGWDMVPDSDKPGWLKYDQKEYINLRKQEALRRLEAMQRIIQSREKANPVQE